MKALIFLLFALVTAFFPTSSWSASTACEGYSPEKLGDVFETAIRLNQRFKQLARRNDSDDAAYAAALRIPAIVNTKSADRERGRVKVC